MSTRAELLATRVEQGAQALAAFAEQLSDREWQTICADDGRTVGVLTHHVATALLGETGIVKQLASGQPLAGLTWPMVDEGNAAHAHEHARAGQREAAELLRQNGAIAAEAIRLLSHEQLDVARGAQRAGVIGFAYPAARGRITSTTAARITPMPSRPGALICSPARPTPSSTATTGLTYAKLLDSAGRVCPSRYP